MFDETGCDAVMIGRASLGNPWIFKHIATLLANGATTEGPSAEDRVGMIRRHLEMEMTYIGSAQGLRNFRKHLLWYTKGLKGGASLRQMLGQLHDRDALLQVVDDHFSAQIRP